MSPLSNDLREVWNAIYLERDHCGRGPCEREAMELAYGGERWDSDGLGKVHRAKLKDSPWPWSKGY